MIDGENYLQRLTGINLQFDLALRAVDGFKGSAETIENYLTEELDSMRKFTVEAAKSSGFDPEKHWVFSAEGSKKYLDAVKVSLPGQLDQVVNRLRQNKLILLITLLESFLKDIHREILRKNPSLLKADRQIPLGKLVSQPTNEIIEEEIEREVQGLDRKSVEQRSEYFDKHLNIDWFGGTIIPFLKPVLELRNRVLHENPDTVVSEEDLDLAHVVCMALPMGCLFQAAVLYPDRFKWGNAKFDGTKEIMEKQGRLKPNPSVQPTPASEHI